MAQNSGVFGSWEFSIVGTRGVSGCLLKICKVVDLPAIGVLIVGRVGWDILCYTKKMTSK